MTGLSEPKFGNRSLLSEVNLENSDVLPRFSNFNSKISENISWPFGGTKFLVIVQFLESLQRLDCFFCVWCNPLKVWTRDPYHLHTPGTPGMNENLTYYKGRYQVAKWFLDPHWSLWFHYTHQDSISRSDYATFVLSMHWWSVSDSSHAMYARQKLIQT